jgi:hypothetical protein
MLISISTYLTAKILTYYFNALVDAQMAEEIVVYIKSGRKRFASNNTEAQQRAEKLVNSIHNPPDDYLIGLAYTLYYVNALANHLYVRILSPCIGKSQQKSIAQTSADLIRTLNAPIFFESFKKKKLFLLTYWLHVATNPFRWVNQFIHDRKIELQNPARSGLVAATHEVQKQNREWNQYIATLLLNDKKSDIPKVVLLRKAAQQSHNAQLFLTACANTQKAAARWDWVYTKLLKK